jgi:lincosamide nucleotidyltransferase A/C/D/E
MNAAGEGLAMSRRGLPGRIRLAALAGARRAYLALARGRFGRVAQLRAVQRVRRRWQHPMELRDVEEIVGALSAAGVRWWLAGGWGVDALVGRQTRRHKDLDVVVERSALDTAIAALAALGFTPVPESYPGADRHVPAAMLPDRELVQDAAARTVDLHPVDHATWRPRIGAAHAFATGALGGREVGCLSVAAQVAAHQGFELAEEHRANIRWIQAISSPPGAC